LVSAIILFLLLLGSAHAQEIAAMLKADIEEIGGGSSYDSGTQDSSVYALPPHHYSNNEIRLHNGQHVALEMIVALYAAISMVLIHLISCMLLLYGSVMHVRQCLLPWLTVVKIELMFLLALLLLCVILGHGVTITLLVTGLLIHL
ncbi:hypothetical protein Cfor_09412, partial [Coptotermes formosanus]